MRDQRAQGLQVRHHLLRQVALVEGARAFFGNLAQHGGHAFVAQRRTDGLGAAVGAAVQLAAVFAVLQALQVADAAHGGLVDPEGVHAGSHKVAVRGPADGGLHHLPPRQAAVRLVHGLQALERGRRADGLGADVVDAALEDEAEAVLGLALQQVLPHVFPGRQRRGRVEVEIFMHLGARQVHGGGAETCDAAHQRIDHRLRQRGGHGGVHRVAACAQDVDAGFGGLRLRADHHCFFFHEV
ncbi:hypothetical protein D9M68_591900 [compost metagenome]